MTGAAGQIGLGRAGAGLAHPLGEHPAEALVDRALHQGAAAGRAGLAGILGDDVDDGGCGGLEVGVLEDDLRRLAAELQHAGMWFFAAATWTSVPTSGEPVKETKSMPGCAVSAAPASSP